METRRVQAQVPSRATGTGILSAITARFSPRQRLYRGAVSASRGGTRKIKALRLVNSLQQNALPQQLTMYMKARIFLARGTVLDPAPLLRSQRHAERELVKALNATSTGSICSQKGTLKTPCSRLTSNCTCQTSFKQTHQRAQRLYCMFDTVPLATFFLFLLFCHSELVRQIASSMQPVTQSLRTSSSDRCILTLVVSIRNDK